MEKFNLKWNDFLSNVHKSFQNLRKEDDFFDITLVGDDSKHVTAHKLVLASGSKYFKKIFSNNKKYFQSNGLICLEGLNQNDLNNVLDYIYYGELQIYQYDLDRFLGIAERLKLEGLNGGEQLQYEDDGKTKHIVEENVSTPQNNLVVPKNEYQMTKDVRIKEKPVVSVQSSDIQSLEELDQKVEGSFSRDAEGLFSCHYCPKIFKNKGHAKEHVEIHFEGLAFPCQFCDSILRSRSSLRTHYNKCHK